MSGGGSQTTTSGFAQEYKPEIKAMLADAENLYDQGRLGQVAGETSEFQKGIDAGTSAGESQIGLAQNMSAIAQQPVDLSGARAKSLLDAQKALGTSSAMAGASNNLGGSRSALDTANIEQNLAANFANIDQQAQQQQMQNLNAALGAQAEGANTLGQVGQAKQQLAQAQADADYTAIAQRVGLFSGLAPKETVKTGGK